jgi:hypothetical protein
MSIEQLDIGWASTASERRRLRWELMSADDVGGVFLNSREDVLAVVWKGDTRRFGEFARSLARDALPTTNRKGVL